MLLLNDKHRTMTDNAVSSFTSEVRLLRPKAFWLNAVLWLHSTTRHDQSLPKAAVNSVVDNLCNQ